MSAVTPNAIMFFRADPNMALASAARERRGKLAKMMVVDVETGPSSSDAGIHTSTGSGSFPAAYSEQVHTVAPGEPVRTGVRGPFRDPSINSTPSTAKRISKDLRSSGGGKAVMRFKNRDVF